MTSTFDDTGGDDESGSLKYPIRQEFVTADPERAHEFITSTYVNHRPQVSGNRENFQFRAAMADAGGFSVERLDYSMTVRAEVEPFDFVLVRQVLGGRCDYADGRDDIQVGAGELSIGPPFMAMTARWENVRLGIVRLGVAALEETAAELTGAERASVRMEMSYPISDGHARYWQAVVRHVTHGLLPNEQAMASPLIRNHTQRMLTLAALQSFPNSTLNAENKAPDQVAPAAVRRAVDFIEQHHGSDISLRDIAAAARIGPRSLQQAFRRYLDTTPSAYLRRLRLEGAHRELRAGDPTRGDTVAAIATRWGFAHHGRFAAAYQEVYGQSPRRTLHS